MNKPYWITVDHGDYFKGHQGHWADCFFSNATRSNIAEFCAGSLCEFREMTDEELVKYPEALTFQKSLIEEYGTD